MFRRRNAFFNQLPGASWLSLRSSSLSGVAAARATHRSRREAARSQGDEVEKEDMPGNGIIFWVNFQAEKSDFGADF